MNDRILNGKDTPSFRPLPSLLILLAVVGVIAVLQYSGVSRFFTRENIEKVSVFVQSTGAWGPLVYILICIVASLLFCPGLPLVLLAVPFGAVHGTIYASTGLTIGACACFLLARYTFRSSIEKMALRTPVFKRSDDGVKREGWRMIIFTRVVLPFNVQNYAYGLTGVGFWTFLFVSMFCMLPAIAAYVFAGGALVSGKGDAKKTLSYLMVALLFFLLLSFLPKLIKKRFAPPQDAK